MARPRHWPSHELGHFFGSGIVEAYRGAVNFYVRSLWQVPGRLDKQTLARLPAECTRLQSMQKAQALRQALTIVSSMRAAGRHLGLRSRAKRSGRSGASNVRLLCVDVALGFRVLVATRQQVPPNWLHRQQNLPATLPFARSISK